MGRASTWGYTSGTDCLAIELGVGVGCEGGEGGSEPSLLSPLDDEDDGGGDWAEDPAGLSSSGPSSLTDLLLESAVSFSGSEGAVGMGLLPDQRGE